MSAAGLRARLDRLGRRRSFSAPDPAIERFLAKRQAQKGPMPTLHIDTLVEMLAPSGALAGQDPECSAETIDIVASMSDADDQLRPDDPDYKAIRLARMVALSLALKPVLRSIAVECGITDETGWAIGKARDVDDRDIARGV